MCVDRCVLLCVCVVVGNLVMFLSYVSGVFFVVDEAKSGLPDEERAALVARWEEFDKSLLKDVITEDGSIRNVDHIEYERMLEIVGKMKPEGYEMSLEPLKDGVSYGLDNLDDEILEGMAGSSNVVAKGPLLGVTKQTKLKMSVAKDGKRILGFELPKDGDEGFASGGKKRRKQ